MMNPVISFCLKLLVFLGMGFFIHISILYFLNLPLFDHLIVFAYVANYLLAVTIYSALYKLRIKYDHILGFVFMGGSFLKFAVYFIFFYPHYKLHGEIETAEAMAFLSPYLLSLLIETIALVKLLNSSD